MLTECKNLHVPTYAQRYDGATKHARLLHIAQHSSNLRDVAYRELLKSLKQSCNTEMYEQVAKSAGVELGGEFIFDKAWMEATDRATQQRLERAESDLATAKNRVNKESIRLGHMEVGNIHYERGNLNEAIKSYFRARDFFSLPQHQADMCLQVATASIANGLHRQAQTYINKIDATDDAVTRAKIRAVAGLNALHDGEKQFRNAARSFLEIDGSIAGNFTHVLAAEDVATYGSLCALATFDRPELRRLLLESKHFKTLLELVPDVRNLIQSFCQSNYGACLLLLEALKPQLLMDLHLHAHAHTLCALVSDRILVQYFTPYQAIDLGRMAEAFAMDLPTLERLTAQLISRGQLAARIDSQNKTLHRRTTDDRRATLAKVQRLATMHTAEVRRGILRLSLVKNGFVVSAKESKAMFSSGGRGGGGGGVGGGARGGMVSGMGGGMGADPSMDVDDDSDDDDDS